MAKDNREITIKNNVIYDGKILSLNCDDVLCPNGIKAKREIVHHHGGVCLLAIVDNKFVFIKQFRYAYGETLYELPAGKLEKNENAYDAGKRELIEEVGLKADHLIDYGEMYPTCGYSDEKIHLYVAEGLTKTERHLDIDENIDIVYLSKEEVLEKIKNNEIKDAKSICLFLRYINNL